MARENKTYPAKFDRRMVRWPGQDRSQRSSSRRPRRSSSITKPSLATESRLVEATTCAGPLPGGDTIHVHSPAPHCGQ